MTKYIKSTILVIAGLCWIAFAVLMCVLLYGYLSGGAGLQVFGFLFPMSSTTIFVGLIHFFGFSAAACVSFIIGIGLFAHGVVPAPEPEKKTPARPEARLAFPGPDVPSTQESDAGLRCVRCRNPLATPVHICPACGWTQPHSSACDV